MKKAKKLAIRLEAQAFVLDKLLAAALDGRRLDDRSISIGTMFAGPVHINVTVAEASGVAAARGKRGKKKAG